MVVFVHPPRYSNSMQKRKGGYEFSFPTFLDFLGDWFLKSLHYFSGYFRDGSRKSTPKAISVVIRVVFLGILGSVVVCKSGSPVPLSLLKFVSNEKVM